MKVVTLIFIILMSNAWKIALILISCLGITNASFCQDNNFINVHFLYGSKPARAYKSVERKWFGGILGGHVGIEVENNKVFNFMKKGKVHWFSKRKTRNSRFAVHSNDEFWGIFRTPAAAVKKATITIPITQKQKLQLDSITRNYLNSTPYDYAFVGMRCGAATYEILAQLGIVKPYSFQRTYLKIFYPKKLRKRLLKKAESNQWPVYREEGLISRRWESD